MDRYDDLRARLADDRAATQRRLAALTRDFDDVVAAASDVATDDEHDPEGATIGFERARVAALADQARDHLADIDRAFARIADDSHGTCERCGGPIAPSRLAARPVARTCITCARRPQDRPSGR